MEFYKRIDVDGSVFELAVNITGSGAPTEKTEAAVGMLYMDTDSEDGNIYKCVSVASVGGKLVYTWKKTDDHTEINKQLNELSKAIENKLDADRLPEAVNDALAQAKESGEFDGEPGTSPTISVATIPGGHRITITDKNSTKTVDVMDGEDGDSGDPGKNGRGITSIKRTSGTGAAGTTDTYTITYSDATTSTFTVYNGADGKTYTLTDADKTEIAELAAGLIDTSLLSIIGTGEVTA